MTELYIRAVLTGILFGTWPLLMNRSGLNGNVSSAVFCGATLLVVLPFAYYSLDMAKLAQANWTYALLACVVSGAGLLLFNGGLAIVTPKTVGTFFVLMITAQIIVPAVYQIVVSGEVTMSKVIGFMLAIAAAYFLSK